MKEIGEKLRDTRESMGISLEEAAEDLKLKSSQINDLEQGNIEAFKDIFDLKYFIRDYSKYLGLKYEDMVNEFNEFLFDYTSKIEISDIKEAQKNNLIKEEEKEIYSPYTRSTEKQKGANFTVKLIFVFTLLLVISGIVYFLFNKEKPAEPIITAYVEGLWLEKYFV